MKIVVINALNVGLLFVKKYIFQLLKTSSLRAFASKVMSLFWMHIQI
jgi:hypothetical protein